MNHLKPLPAPHLEESNYPKGCPHRLHLGVLCQQHVLNSRLTVIQRAVPRHVVPATEGVLCGETGGSSAFGSRPGICLKTSEPRLGGFPLPSLLEQPDAPTPNTSTELHRFPIQAQNCNYSENTKWSQMATMFALTGKGQAAGVHAHLTWEGQRL